MSRKPVEKEETDSKREKVEIQVNMIVDINLPKTISREMNIQATTNDEILLSVVKEIKQSCKFQSQNLKKFQR